MPKTTAYKSHPANVRQADAALYEAEVLVRQHARILGVSVAYFYADNDLLAEAILAFGLLSEPERRQALRDMKAKLGYGPDDEDDGGKRGRGRKAR